jgi:hypothetical protein
MISSARSNSSGERQRSFLPLVLHAVPDCSCVGAVLYKARTEEALVIRSINTENLNLSRSTRSGQSRASTRLCCF